MAEEKKIPRGTPIFRWDEDKEGKDSAEGYVVFHGYDMREMSIGWYGLNSDAPLVERIRRHRESKAELEGDFLRKLEGIRRGNINP